MKNRVKKIHKRIISLLVLIVILLGTFSYQNTKDLSNFNNFDNKIDIENSVKFGINSSETDVQLEESKEKLFAWDGMKVLETYTDIAPVNMLQFASFFKDSKMEKVSQNTVKFTIKGHTFQFTDGLGTALVDGKEYPLVMFHYNNTDATEENNINYNFPEGMAENWAWVGDNLQIVTYSYRNAFMKKYSPLVYGKPDGYIFSQENMTVPVSFLAEFFIIGKSKAERAYFSEIVMDINDVGFVNQYSFNTENKFDISNAPFTLNYKENFNLLPDWIRKEIVRKQEEIYEKPNIKRKDLPYGTIFDINKGSHLSKEQEDILENLSSSYENCFYMYPGYKEETYNSESDASFQDVAYLGIDFIISFMNGVETNAYEPLVKANILPKDFLDNVFSMINTPFYPQLMDRKVQQFKSSNGETYKFFFARYRNSSVGLHVLKKNHPAMPNEMILNYNIKPLTQTSRGTKWENEDSYQIDCLGFREDFGLGVPLYNDFRKSIGLEPIPSWYNTEDEFKKAYTDGTFKQKMTELKLTSEF